MARNTMKWASACAIALMLHACGDGAAPKEGTPAADSLNVPADKSETGVMNVGGKLFSIPSPMETALLIRKLGLPYSKELPLPNEDATRFVSLSQRALALGVYGADLGYVTIHHDGQQAMRTLQTVERLSAGLELTNAFDQHLVERFKKSLSSEDSLLRLTGSAFRSAQEYLKRNSRDNVSTWVLAGGWVESMYLTMAQAGEKPAEGLAQRIGEQRRTLGNLILLLEASDADGSSAPLIAKLKDLQTDYAQVTTSYAFQAPTVDAASKTTYINSTSSVTIPAETVKAIHEKVKAIRSSIIA